MSIKHHINKIIVLLVIELMIINITSAQNKDDLLTNPYELENTLILSNMYSIFDLTYVDSTFTIPQATTPSLKNSTTANLPDSVFQNRLKKLNSAVTIEYSAKVRKYIDFYLDKQNRLQLEIILGLAENYYPMFEKTLNKYKLPDELKYLPLVESSLFLRAVSKNGASGLWLLPYIHARAYNVEINSYVDDRRVPQKATTAAALYLKDLFKIYYDWTLVIAAYNCKPENINKAILKSGNKRKYDDIYQYLPQKSREIVPAYFAMLYIAKYFDKHEVKPKKINITQATDTIVVDDKLHLNQVAEVLKIPVNQLRELNPRYKKDIIFPDKYINYLLLPKGKLPEYIKLKDSIFAYYDTLFFKPSPKDFKGLSVTQPYQSSNVNYSTKNKAKLSYTVKSGDNIGYIAQWYGVTSSAIKIWNNIGTRITSGKVLAIYVPPNKVTKFVKINSLSFEEKQKQFGTSTKKTNTSVNQTSTSELDKSFVYYKVRKGDNLWDIAKKYPGISYQNIMNLNGLRKGYQLKVGQILKIKKK